MVYETVAPKRHASKSKGRATSSHRAQIPSNSKSNRRDTHTLCPLCGEGAKRGQELGRHIIDLHLPDSICCPACSWHGSRKETLKKHVKACGVKPELGECKIYDAKLILRWLLIDSVPLETAVTWALCFVEERARELGKVEAWGPLTEWRKQTNQVLVKM